jgi:ABC-2 type transport system permease protein
VVAASALALALVLSAVASGQSGSGDAAGAQDAPAPLRPVIGFVAGHGEPTVTDGLSGAAEALTPEFDVRTIDLSRGADELAGVAAVVLAGSPDILDVELYELDQYLMRGGRIAFFVDAATIPESGFGAGIAGGNILGFLAAYGVVVAPDLVLDLESAKAAAYGDVKTNMLYPFWPVVGPDGFAESHPALVGCDEVPFAWTSSIFMNERAPEGAESEVLLRSSGRSWSVNALTDIDPDQGFAPEGQGAEVIMAGEGPGAALAVAVSGELNSAFLGKRLIIQRGREVEVTDPVGLIEKSVPTRMIVFGSSRLFRDEFREQFPGNARLFRNLVTWLALSEAPEPVQRTPKSPRVGGPTMPLIALTLLVLVAVCVVVLIVVLGRARA